jgi:hypothetical protein
MPDRTRAVPQRTSVDTKKARMSTDNDLKPAILFAYDVSRSVIVFRTKGQDGFAIDFSNIGLHLRWAFLLLGLFIPRSPAGPRP